MPDLKPCPFCQRPGGVLGRETLVEGGGIYRTRVICNNCGGRVHFSNDRDDEVAEAAAIEAWNRRAPVVLPDTSGLQASDAVLRALKDPAVREDVRSRMREAAAGAFDDYCAELPDNLFGPDRGE